MLTSIKDIAVYGIPDLKLGSGGIAGTHFGKRIAELFVLEVDTLCSWIGQCIGRIETSDS